MRMKSAHKDPAFGVATGIAVWMALSPAVVAQVDSLSPRLNIEEIAPPTVEAVGADLRLLGTASSPLGLVGDQMNVAIASSGASGFLVWQDNAIDGDQLGIGSRYINLQTGVASPQIVRVNQDAVSNQENPKVAVLSNGNAVVVWQSGKSGHQSIRARLLGRTGSVSGAEVTLATGSSTVGNANPAVVALSNGFAVAWEAASNDGLSRKVHLQKFSAAGAPVGEERILGTSARVDRAPSIAVHADGRIVVAWVAEMASADVVNLGGSLTRLEVNTDIFAAVVSAGGQVGSPIWISGGSAPCDAPALAALPNGSTLLGWSEYSIDTRNGWDIRTTVLSAGGYLPGSPVTLNTYRPFEQVGLRFAQSGSDILAVWSSRGADGSGLGASARSLDLSGTPLGDEFVANTAHPGDQFAPAVTSSPQGYRVVWSGLAGIATGVDIQAKDIRKLPISGRRAIKLYWNTVPGERQTLEFSTDLVNWNTQQAFPPAESNQQSITLDPGTVPNTYFRVKLTR